MSLTVIRISRRAVLAIAACIGLLFGAAGPAAAQEKRPVPDYDGRPERTSLGDALLWVPRVIFFPAYLVTDYLVRRPLGYLITAAEKGNWPAAILGAVQVGHNPMFTIVPTAYIDFGFKPSVGVYVFSNDVFAKSNDLRFRFGTWGTSWLALGFADRLTRGPLRLTARVDWTRRPDYLFYGLGPSTRSEDKSRYQARSLETALETRYSFGRSLLEGQIGWRDVDFRDGTCCGDPSLAEQVASGMRMPPPAFPDGYSGVFQNLEFILETRPRPEYPQNGIRVDLQGEHGHDTRGTSDDWLRYGATVAGFVDLDRHARVVSLQASASFARPMSGGTIPFTEMVHLGGYGPMSGFQSGRLVGESGIAATLRYEWPVWVWLDGMLAAEVGNVFGRDLEDFETDKLRMSYSLGLRSVGPPDHRFQLIVGIGTDTFEDGARVTSFRLAIGGTNGF